MLEEKNSRKGEIITKGIILLIISVILEFYLRRFDFFKNAENRILVIILVVVYSSTSMFTQENKTQRVVGNRGR